MQRSWLDWLADRVDAVPGPRALVYAAAVAIWALLTSVIGWSVGNHPFPEVVRSPIVAAMFPAAMLWSMRLLDGVAVRALAEVGPALTLEPAEVESIAGDLQRTPPSWALLAVPLGVAAGIGSVLGGAAGWELNPGEPAVTWAVTTVAASVDFIVALGFVVHVVHQLRLVDAIHRRFVTIDLYHLEPLYAFARLTSLTGMTLIGIGIGGLVLVSILVPAFSFRLAPSDLVLFGSLALVAIACFIVPLLGLHERIEQEKDQRMAEAHATLASALAEVRSRIAANDLDGAARINDAVVAANTGVQVIARASTWPWRTETLNGFLSAVFLPILLWLVITLLGRLLPA